MLFSDRHDAGKQLALQLKKYEARNDIVVLGLSRGGVVTAFEVAVFLKAPLNVVVVRKIGAPGNPELALGAVAEHGEGVFNEHLIGLLGVSREYLASEVERQKMVVKQRLALYRGNTEAPEIKGKTVILVDDGIATGASMRAAIKSVRASKAKKIVLAVPVASPDSLLKIEKEVDEVVCLDAPAFFEAVGSFYRLFDQTTDDEIIRLLAKNRS
ncbi:MAG: phosphoribosyltransferase [Parachlamydiales bacterium]